MKESFGESKQNFLYKNLNIIKKLKDYKDKDKITLLLDDYNKKQEMDYFLTQNNIRIGKINNNIEYNKRPNPFTYHVSSPKKTIHQNQRRQVIMGDNSHSNSLSNFKRSISLSSRKITRLTQNMDISNNQKKNVIDNVELKKYFNDIRQRINNRRTKKHLREKFFTETPLNIWKTLYKQEKLFKKIMKEKNNKKINEENIKTKIKTFDIKDLLINKSSNYNKKNLELSILDKNLNKENKYRNNLWNITLRNCALNGKYEKLGYLNIGNKFEPRYTFFNMNKNLEYFSIPNNSNNYQTEYGKIKLNKKNICLNLDDNLYNTKTRQNLQHLNSIENLEISGKNLLDFEETRERKIKGNKILHKNEYLEYLYNKKANKVRAPDAYFEEKTFAENYNEIDFMKNINLNSKIYL